MRMRRIKLKYFLIIITEGHPLGSSFSFASSCILHFDMSWIVAFIGIYCFSVRRSRVFGA